MTLLNFEWSCTPSSVWMKNLELKLDVLSWKTKTFVSNSPSPSRYNLIYNFFSLPWFKHWAYAKMWLIKQILTDFNTESIAICSSPNGRVFSCPPERKGSRSRPAGPLLSKPFLVLVLYVSSKENKKNTHEHLYAVVCPSILLIHVSVCWESVFNHQEGHWPIFPFTSYSQLCFRPPSHSTCSSDVCSLCLRLINRDRENESAEVTRLEDWSCIQRCWHNSLLHNTYHTSETVH